jgi:hypothetical protein
MREKEFRDYLKGRGLDVGRTESAVEAVHGFEGHLRAEGKNIDSASVEDLKGYISLLMGEGRCSYEGLLDLARYVRLVNMNDLFVYIASIVGARSVLPSISERLAAIAGEEARRRVFDGVEAPPPGSPPEAFPPVTELMMERLEAGLPPEVCRRVLAGNHHLVPREGFKEQREMYLRSGDIDEVLKVIHGRAVKELEEHMAEGKIWYEQRITPRVVEFVKGNQEILAGVRDGDRIYMTKIPYAPDDYLGETDPLMRRYYACHCPLARASILRGDTKISPTWCYCSGGFEKLQFDVIFDEELEVEVLESVLAGDDRCRFAVKMPEEKLR